MDIYTSVEEKYLQAIEELQCGDLPLALRYFNQIIAFDEDYARAYFQLGHIYHIHFKDFKTAGYYYKRCIELNPEFPDAHQPYLEIVIVLKMHNLIKQVAERALNVPGVEEARIYESLGLYAERQQNFEEAARHFKKAEFFNEETEEAQVFQAHQKRVRNKMNSNKIMVYDLQG